MPGFSLPCLSRWGAAAAVACALVVLPGTPAQADTTAVPGELSTAATNTSHIDLAVPRGVRVRAITGVLTMPEVVEGGVVTFRVNGRTAETVESSLYQKVTIQVRPADVIADGTIGLTMTSAGPATPAGCRPNAGAATLKRIALTYTGTETPPRTVATFFPPSAARVDVLVPADADADMLEAGLTAVAALSSRYRDDTEIELGTAAPPATEGAAHHRVVVLAAGRPGEVTTAISSTGGVPTLTLTGVGGALTAAARALSSAGLGLATDGSENLSQELKPRNVERVQTLAELGADEISLSGFGTLTHRLEIPQDAFGTPVSALALDLRGSHSAVSEADRARLDIHMNGALVGSAVLDADADLDLPVNIPAGRLRAVNELELTLSALAPDGATCAAGGAPTVDVDINTEDSTVTATRGTGKVTGFQLYPQVFEGTLPVALRSRGEQRFDAAIDAARLIQALQQASASPLEIQLIDADAFLADDRSGLFLGATNSDSAALEAPLVFSATRQVETNDSTFEVTSQQTYAALQSIKQADRTVLMLGSWAPGDAAAPANLSHKIADAVRAMGWAALDGDLVIADADSAAFVADSGVEPGEAVVEEETSYVKWFVLVIGLVLLVIAFQVLVSIRRDRRVAKSQREAEDREVDEQADGEGGRQADTEQDTPVYAGVYEEVDREPDRGGPVELDRDMPGDRGGDRRGDRLDDRLGDPAESDSAVDDLMEAPDALAGVDDETAAAAGVPPATDVSNRNLRPRPRKGLKWTPRPWLEPRSGATEATEYEEPTRSKETSEPTETLEPAESTEQANSTESTEWAEPTEPTENAAPEKREPRWKRPGGR